MIDLSKYKEYLNKISEKIYFYNTKLSFDDTHTFYDIINSGIDSVDKYSDYIKMFFSTPSKGINNNLGEANNIKILYDKISNLSYTNNRPIVVFLSPLSFDIYDEYITGMTKFILDIIQAIKTRDQDQIEIFYKQIETAKKNDLNFISRIIADTKQEIQISEAINILDQLIDFIPKINEFDSIIGSFEDSPNDDDYIRVLSQPLVKEAIYLLVKSINTYCHDVLSVSLNTYKIIWDSVENTNSINKPDFEDKPLAVF